MSLASASTHLTNYVLLVHENELPSAPDALIRPAVQVYHFKTKSFRILHILVTIGWKGAVSDRLNGVSSVNRM